MTLLLLNHSDSHTQKTTCDKRNVILSNYLHNYILVGLPKRKKTGGADPKSHP